MGQSGSRQDERCTRKLTQLPAFAPCSSPFCVSDAFDRVRRLTLGLMTRDTGADATLQRSWLTDPLAKLARPNADLRIPVMSIVSPLATPA